MNEEELKKRAVTVAAVVLVLVGLWGLSDGLATARDACYPMDKTPSLQTQGNELKDVYLRHFSGRGCLDWLLSLILSNKFYSIMFAGGLFLGARRLFAANR